jgi:pimeloyl-ACP methyl ester carboxylesterase
MSSARCRPGRSVYRIVAGSGHAISHEAPDAVAAAVFDRLDGLRSFLDERHRETWCAPED